MNTVHTEIEKNTIFVAMQTLGCKLNQAESDSIATRLKQMGYSVIDRDAIESGTPLSKAKYVVINTCTVTAKADRKSRHNIYQALKGTGLFKEEATRIIDTHDTTANFIPAQDTTSLQNINAKVSLHRPIVIVTGCFVGSSKKEIESMQVDYIVDNSKKSYIPEIIDAHEKKQIFDYNALEANYFSFTPSDQSFHTRNNLKIQDGCDNFCTFCIIPLVRGHAQSLPLQKVVQNARTMIENGSKEIVLTGVNMSRYRDASNEQHYNFSDLLEALLKMGENSSCRFHISSLEPDKLDDKFYDLLQHPKLCSHLHLCLQSGSDKILLKMRRMYSVNEYMSCIERIKMIDDDFNFTTDIIIGFPDESEDDFAQSMNIATQVGFSHIHIFPYSARQGTRAERMRAPNTYIIKEHINTMQTLSNTQKKEYRLSMLHKEQTLLIEKTTHNNTIGYGMTNYYVPVEIQPHANDIMHNSFVKVTPNLWREDKELILIDQNMQAMPTNVSNY